MQKIVLLALLISVLMGEVLACSLSLNGRAFSEFETGYRLFHLLQMVMLIAWAGLLYRSLASETVWKRVSRLIFAGLCLSFAGDVINSFLFDLGFILQPQTLLSVIPFAIAHILYITAFWKISRSGVSTITARPFMATLVFWPILSVGLWSVLVDASAGPVLSWLSLAYAHMVVMMALTSIWPLRVLGRAAWVATAGGFIFLLSDAVFGAWLAEGQSRPLWVSQLIWTSYFLAQLCILHVPLIGSRLQQPAAA